MNNIVLVDIRNEYGQDRYFPANETAESLASIANTTTLTKHTLNLAEGMGFEIAIAQKTLDLGGGVIKH
jgi:hypothetical protein